MSHHGSKPPEDNPERIRELVSGPAKEAMRKHLEAAIGATGAYPDGQLNKTDEGELAFAVGVENGVVVVKFGKPVAWLGLQPDQACELGRLLITKAGRSCTIGFGE